MTYDSDRRLYGRISDLERDNVSLTEQVERLRDALSAMMNEHTPLGQHPNGEIEYCHLPACINAQNVQRTFPDSTDAARSALQGEPK